MLACVWNAKEKNLFRAEMNKWFRREYFVEKSSGAIVSKRNWITVKGKYLFKVLKFTVKGLIRGADIPFTVNFRTLNKYFPLTVIQFLLLTIASELFSTKYSRLNHLFIPALKRFFSFAFHTQANMVYKYAHKFTNYFQKLTHIFLFVLSFVLRVDSLTFFHSRTEFLLQ